MRLVPLEIPDESTPLPADAERLIHRGRSRIDRWLARPDYRVGLGFIPSDYEQVWQALAAIRRRHPEARRMLEWGSGFGIVAGLGAVLGLEACGIELDATLVERSRELMSECGLNATFAAGSFVPEAFDVEQHDDLETRTALGHPDAYDELGYDLDDFDLVFAYPWPGEEELYCEILRSCGVPGAILLTWSNRNGARAYMCR